MLTALESRSRHRLTYDDGPHVDMEFIANAINNAGYKATFFVNGWNFGCIFDEANVRRLRNVYNQGVSAAAPSKPFLGALTA